MIFKNTNIFTVVATTFVGVINCSEIIMNDFGCSIGSFAYKASHEGETVSFFGFALGASAESISIYGLSKLSASIKTGEAPIGNVLDRAKLLFAQGVSYKCYDLKVFNSFFNNKNDIAWIDIGVVIKANKISTLSKSCILAEAFLNHQKYPNTRAIKDIIEFAIDVIYLGAGVCYRCLNNQKIDVDFGSFAGIAITAEGREFVRYFDNIKDINIGKNDNVLFKKPSDNKRHWIFAPEVNLMNVSYAWILYSHAGISKIFLNTTCVRASFNIEIERFKMKNNDASIDSLLTLNNLSIIFECNLRVAFIF